MNTSTSLQALTVTMLNIDAMLPAAILSGADRAHLEDLRAQIATLAASGRYAEARQREFEAVLLLGEALDQTSHANSSIRRRVITMSSIACIIGAPLLVAMLLVA